MAGGIKLFQSFKKYSKSMGIDLSQSNQKCSFTPINLLILVLFVQMFISSSAFFLFKAKSAYDYGFSFYISVAELLGLTIYLSIIGFKLADVVTLIQKYEDFIGMSKRTHFISENNFRFHQK